MKTALLFGATGFVGSYLLEELLRDPDYAKVIVVSRRKLTLDHPKLKTVMGEFETLSSIADQLIADDLYLALGTTKAKTPDPKIYYQIDHDYPVLAARFAKERGAKSVSVVTAIGSNAGSKLFYPRTKGELERDLLALNFERTNIFQPSMIMGERSEKRPMEKAFMSLFATLEPLLAGKLARYRGIDGQTIARAMAKAPKAGADKVAVYRWQEMKKL